MSRKTHRPGPIPAANRPHAGPSYQAPEQDEELSKEGEGSADAFQEEDPKRRLGDYTDTAEHARQQPGPLNDGGQRHSEDGR